MKEILIHSRKYPGRVALIDDADFELVNCYRWNLQINKYATYAKSTTGIYMHRLLFPDATIIDHWDHNGLNNLRSNLRCCTQSENLRNWLKREGQSRFLGVGFMSSGKRKKRWYSRLTVRGIIQRFGYFYTEEEAAMAYNIAKEGVL